MTPNKITGANAGGPRELAMRTRWAARVAQFGRSARARDAGSFEQEATEMDSVLCFLGYLLLNL